MPTPADVLRTAQQRVNEFLDDIVGEGLFDEWSEAASGLYKEQFAKKENPYGEPWTYRSGDEKRTTSYYKFGKPDDVGRDGFSLGVAAANGKRSCVPFEPRGLGRWRPRFDQILRRRASIRFSLVRP